MTKAKPSIIFLGSGAFGVPTLAAMAEHYTIAAIVTQPDRPAGRGMKLTSTPIATFAAESLPDVPILRPENVNAPEVVAQLHGLGHGALAWVVIAFGQKLSPALLGSFFCCNLHGSILPRWRGAAPINWAIISGDGQTGNTMITIADRMDAGLVLGTSSRQITDDVTTGELHDLLAADGPQLVREVLLQHAAGTLVGKQQDEALVTKARKLSRADAWVDFAAGAQVVTRRINGLAPWPGVDALLQVSEPDLPLKLWQAKPVGQIVMQAMTLPSDSRPGTLLDARAGIVLCGPAGGPTLAQLLKVQVAGGRVVTWPEFASGRSWVGSPRLSSQVPSAPVSVSS